MGGSLGMRLVWEGVYTCAIDILLFHVCLHNEITHTMCM